MKQPDSPRPDSLEERLRHPETVREAFAEMVALYSERLYWVARKLVGTHEEADDVLQNTFLKVWNNIENFRGDARLSTWLYKIVVNESLSHLEREKNHRQGLDLTDGATQVAAPAEVPLEGDELAARLRQAVDTLPEKQRLVFNMKYFDDLKYEEISEILGTTVGALKASYHLAVKKIEQFFTGGD